MRRKVGDWNKIDVKLFDYFNETLWRRVKEGGERFQKDLRTLKKLNKKLTEQCLQPDGYNYSRIDPNSKFFVVRPQVKKGFGTSKGTGTSKGAGTSKEIEAKMLYDLCQQMSDGSGKFTFKFKKKQTKHNWTKPQRRPFPFPPVRNNTKVTKAAV